jgi:uncharacterized phage protein (TIGR02218 family)
MAVSAKLQAHLDSGATSLCRCWRITRRDGAVLAFTDHDAQVGFDGIVFRARDGLSARALEQTTGLSVDNSEAAGILSDSGLMEADILAGLYDRAEVVAWLVNWADPAEHALLLRGTLGEIERDGTAFRAELRGLAEALNQPQGRVFQKPCSAILGDADCRVDLDALGYFDERPAEAVEGDRVLHFADFTGFADRWFEKGRLLVLSGASEGAVAVIKNDRLEGSARRVELWQALPAGLVAGDMLRLEAGCDKRAETCRLKFDNLLNFRGFPHIPGDDWLMAHPAQPGANDGGSLQG